MCTSPCYVLFVPEQMLNCVPGNNPIRKFTIKTSKVSCIKVRTPQETKELSKLTITGKTPVRIKHRGNSQEIDRFGEASLDIGRVCLEISPSKNNKTLYLVFLAFPLFWPVSANNSSEPAVLLLLCSQADKQDADAFRGLEGHLSL